MREALRALGGERPGLRETARRVRRWDGAIALAEAHAVAESVWAGLVLRGVADEVPADARDALEAAHASATARNALLLLEATEIQAALTATGVESVVLKGPALLVAHYPSIGARHVADIDLLVRERDLERAAEVAREGGATVPAGPVDFDGTEARSRYHLPPMETHRGVALELHHRLPGGDPDGADVEGVFQRSRLVAHGGRALRIPSPADLAAIACMHVCTEHLGLAKYLPRHVADLSVLLDSGATSWAHVAPLCSAPGGAVAVAASRAALERRGRTSVGFNVLVVRERLRTLLHGGSAWRAVFPSREFMAERYGTRGGAWSLPLLYLWRPLRTGFRILTGR